ncbi:hypothetical protein V5799_008187, partial [Amblyomma americanum]
RGAEGAFVSDRTSRDDFSKSSPVIALPGFKISGPSLSTVYQFGFRALRIKEAPLSAQAGSAAGPHAM